ncbi:Hypothetical predicted protein [Marmota monax]|uniref:Uncharacterized protein n=1 Tax=Marmota monax TaxID=9995 RepID=A0A5E4AM24_MARMO|nr:hypothetical protein GHT09_019247 [Marmota monax]VTJ58010.1 Hypothetical predicted protein [Marmota monax]
MSPSPLGSGVLPPGPPTRRCRLQVRRCDSRRSGVELEPFVSPRSVVLAGGPVRSFSRPGERSPRGPRPVARAGPGAGPGSFTAELGDLQEEAGYVLLRSPFSSHQKQYILRKK